MQLFRVGLQKHAERIKKATYCDSVEFLTYAYGEFALLVTWLPTKAAPAGDHKIIFTRARVLGRTANAPPLQQRYVKHTCKIADEVIAEILRARGV